jgi:hypothetical protein
LGSTTTAISFAFSLPEKTLPRWLESFAEKKTPPRYAVWQSLPLRTSLYWRRKPVKVFLGWGKGGGKCYRHYVPTGQLWIEVLLVCYRHYVPTGQLWIEVLLVCYRHYVPTGQLWIEVLFILLAISPSIRWAGILGLLRRRRRFGLGLSRKGRR